MGMSASQARLLSITARMNDVEYKSQQISNVKIRLADESEQVANAYTKALNKQKYTLTNYSNGTAQKVNLTANELLKSNSPYRLKASNGKMIVASDIKNNYEGRMLNWNKYVAGNVSSNNPQWNFDMEYKPDKRYQECEHEFVLQAIWGKPSWNQVYTDHEKKYENFDRSKGGYTPMLEVQSGTQEQVDYYIDLFAQLFDATTGDVVTVSEGVFGNEVVPEHQDKTVNTDALISLDDSIANDPNWLYEAIESGEFMLVSVATGKEVSVSGESALCLESDTTGLAKAEAEYTAATAKINSKEKKLDNELKSLDTEHNALKTEFDSVKSLIGDNVEKSFNLFS